MLLWTIYYSLRNKEDCAETQERSQTLAYKKIVQLIEKDECLVE
jgi:hypothetical protein